MPKPVSAAKLTLNLALPWCKFILIIWSLHGTLTWRKTWRRKYNLFKISALNFACNIKYFSHISIEKFGKLNWLPIEQRYMQPVNQTVFKLIYEQCPKYLIQDVQNKTQKFKLSFCKNYRPKYYFFSGPSIWNSNFDMTKTKNISFSNKEKYLYNPYKNILHKTDINESWKYKELKYERLYIMLRFINRSYGIKKCLNNSWFAENLSENHKFKWNILTAYFKMK